MGLPRFGARLSQNGRAWTRPESGPNAGMKTCLRAEVRSLERLGLRQVPLTVPAPEGVPIARAHPRTARVPCRRPWEAAISAVNGRAREPSPAPESLDQLTRAIRSASLT